MNEFIKILLSLSISGTFLMLFIWGLKLLYKNKFSRRWQYYIWIIVVLRFLVPFTIESQVLYDINQLVETAFDSANINIRSLLKEFYINIITNEALKGSDTPITINTNDNALIQSQAPSQIEDNENLIENNTIENNTIANNTIANNIILDNANTKKLFNIYFYLFFVWLVLALTFLVRKITIYQSFIRYIKAGNIEVSDIKILNLLSDVEEKLNIKTRIEMYHNSLIMSPIMIGFIHPSIILPDRELNDKELSYIFMHELSHYKQLDMFYKWLVQIVICIHWFNPFVYLLEKEVNKACEMSCDETVIARLGDSVKCEYGDTLISFLKANNLYKGSLASVTLTEGAEQLKERLGAIMNFREKTITIKILTGILTLCIMFGAAFVGVYPVSAAEASKSVETDKLPIQEKKNLKTYIYDENVDAGYYLDDEDLSSGWDKEIWKDEYKEIWKDEYWDNFDWDDDKVFSEMYSAYGIEKNGKSIYYQGNLIYIFLDHRTDSSFYRLNMNPEGTASIKIIRDKEDKITGVSYMTDKEVESLIGRPFGGKEDIPVINTMEWDSSELLTIEAYYMTDEIYILPSKTNKVVLKEYLTENKSDYYADIETKNNTLTISAGDRPKSNYTSYIEIYVPNNAIDKLKVETVSGEITVKDYAGVVELYTTSGDINIFDSNISQNVNNNVKVETVSGEITVSECASVVDLYTTSGDIDILDSNISGNINTNSGDIELYLSDMLGDLDVNSHSGEISAILPNSIVKAETSTGKIKSSYFDAMNENGKEVWVSIGDNPKYVVKLKTFSADIEIN